MIFIDTEHVTSDTQVVATDVINKTTLITMVTLTGQSFRFPSPLIGRHLNPGLLPTSGNRLIT